SGAGFSQTGLGESAGEVVATNTQSAGSGGTMIVPFPFNLVLPKKNDYYLIREDQLETLTKGGKSKSLEISTFCGGAALGLLPYLGAYLFATYDASAATIPSVIDLGFGLLGIVLGVIAIIKFLDHRSKRQDVDELQAKIKSGQITHVGN